MIMITKIYLSLSTRYDCNTAQTTNKEENNMVATFTTGLMGSGKSKSLVEKVKKDKTFYVILSAKLKEKTGTIGVVESRNGQFVFSVNINANEHEEVTKFIDSLFSLRELETIYIDEVQFLNKTVLSKILNKAIEKEIDIHFYGLSTTFTGDYFEASKYLLSVIDPENIFVIPMNCEYEGCKSIAEYNARIINGKVVKDGDVFVEEKSKYLAYCKKHFNQESWISSELSLFFIYFYISFLTITK